MFAAQARPDEPVVPVTAVIPCYNCAGTLERAVSSIARQTARPAELILVDDASTDSTRTAIAYIQRHYGAGWIRVISLERNCGPATARNAGWDAARHPYVAFLDADDAWHHGKLGLQFAYMQSHPDVALTAHACKLALPGETTGADVSLRGTRNLTCSSLLASNRIATRTVMLRRELPYRFKDGKRYAEDYLLWLQIACDGNRVTLLDAEWAYVFKSEFGEGGLSARLWKMEREILAAFRQLATEGRLARSVALLYSMYSLLKYVRRLAIVAFRRVRSWK